MCMDGVAKRAFQSDENELTELGAARKKRVVDDAELQHMFMWSCFKKLLYYTEIH